MVSFTNIEYQIAYNKGKEQEAMIQQIITEKGITSSTSDEDIDHLIHEFMKSN
jgi:hypothetical protein